MGSTASQKTPILGIVMPCYNLGPFIQTAIDSILSQTFTDYQVYIVDDASTDPATIETLKQLSETLPVHFSIDFQKKNRGMHRVTNYASKHVESKYLFVFSPDDEMRPTYLEETVGYLESHPKTAAVCTWLEYFGETNGTKKYSEDSCKLPGMLFENGFSGSAVIRKNLWDTTGGYDEHPSQKVHEDYNLWLDFLRNGYTLSVIPKPLLRYRIRSDSLSHCVNEETETAWMEYITEKYSDLYVSYAIPVIQFIWKRQITQHSRFEESMRGHEWLDSEYKKQQIQISDMAAVNTAISAELNDIKSHWTHKAVRKVKRLLRPVMR